MPTRQVESEHDEVRQSSTENARATAEAEPNHPAPEQGAAGVESPSADSPTQPEAATAQPRHSSQDDARAEAGQMQGASSLPRDTNADDTDPGAGDQDIDTAGTEADELSVSRAALGFSRSDSSPAKVL